LEIGFRITTPEADGKIGYGDELELLVEVVAIAAAGTELLVVAVVAAVVVPRVASVRSR
jgi:hypothetical protein